MFAASPPVPPLSLQTPRQLPAGGSPAWCELRECCLHPAPTKPSPKNPLPCPAGVQEEAEPPRCCLCWSCSSSAYCNSTHTGCPKCPLPLQDTSPERALVLHTHPALKTSPDTTDLVLELSRQPIPSLGFLCGCPPDGAAGALLLMLWCCFRAWGPRNKARLELLGPNGARSTPSSSGVSSSPLSPTNNHQHGLFTPRSGKGNSSALQLPRTRGKC